MSGPDQNSSTPWWVVLLAAIEKFIKDNWSGLAVILYGYEKQKVDAAKQNQQTAELKEKLIEDENKILKVDSGKSDDDIIREQLERDESESD